MALVSNVTCIDTDERCLVQVLTVRLWTTGFEPGTFTPGVKLPETTILNARFRLGFVFGYLLCVFTCAHFVLGYS